MKRKMLSSLVAGIMVIASVYANVEPSTQPVSGIYKSASDFTQKKVTNALSTIDRKHRLNLHTKIASSKIDVIDGENKVSYKRNEIFGYRDNGIDYRIDGEKELAIVDASSIVLYKNTISVPEMKGHSHKETVYYFSADVASGIKLLTRENLKAAYVTNNRFRYYLDAFFKSDSDLIAFDGTLNKFKIEYIYETSVKDNEGIQAKNTYKPLL